MKQYQVGEYLVHETNGVCVVTGIEEKALQGKGSERLYYVLQPVFQKKSSVITPVDNAKVRIRDIQPKNVIENIFKQVPELEVIEADNDRARGELYKERMNSFDLIELARVVKTVYLRRLARLEEGKKVMAQDEKVYAIAGKKLFEEIAFTLDEEVEQVEERFLNTITA